jgi:D-threonate/D-erythronate kinase
MLGVLADDFSGAAEVAGVAFRYGLVAAVELDAQTPTASDLAVIDLDSRSKSFAEAVRRTWSAIEHAPCVFKKIDSVLRGHVVAEIQPFLQSGRYARALVVPFNPDLGRTINDGLYRVNGRPISQTPFRDDPEFPSLTSDVLAMLRPGGTEVRVSRLSGALAETGIIVGEGETDAELRAWARRVDENTLPVGGAPFFAAWLESRGWRSGQFRKSSDVGSRVLVVSGSTSRVVDWAYICAEANAQVLPMPMPAFDSGSHDSVTDWVKAVAQALNETGLVVASIGAARRLDRSQSSRLVGHLAELAASVLARSRVDQLWLEGGATASAVIRRLGWRSLTVVGELAPGVVQLRPISRGPLITVKPGSYPLRAEQIRAGL